MHRDFDNNNIKIEFMDYFYEKTAIRKKTC